MKLGTCHTCALARRSNHDQARTNPKTGIRTYIRADVVQPCSVSLVAQSGQHHRWPEIVSWLASDHDRPCPAWVPFAESGWARLIEQESSRIRDTLSKLGGIGDDPTGEGK